MGTDIYGWVEVRPFWANDEDEWRAIIDAALIVGRNYETFGRLFGVRMTGEETWVPLAANRGLPATMSETVRRETTRMYDETGTPYLGNRVNYSATWLAWSEIQTLDWSEFGPDYQTLFRLMQVLADGKRYEELPLYTDLRLVVWFDN